MSHRWQADVPYKINPCMGLLFLLSVATHAPFFSAALHQRCFKLELQAPEALPSQTGV